MINLVMSGDITHLVAGLSAAFFIPSLTLALGNLRSSSKLFEVVYMLWWYAGPINQVDALNFNGTGGQLSMDQLLEYWVGTGILIGMAILGGWRQIRRQFA